MYWVYPAHLTEVRCADLIKQMHQNFALPKNLVLVAKDHELEVPEELPNTFIDIPLDSRLPTPATHDPRIDSSTDSANSGVQIEAPSTPIPETTMGENLFERLRYVMQRGF